MGKKKPQPAPDNTPRLKDRTIEVVRVPASELVNNAKNYALHDEVQLKALAGAMREVGFTTPVLARRLEDGKLLVLDGHARVKVAGDEVIPVQVLDVNEKEGDIILATANPLAAMAGRHEAMLEDLLASLEIEDEALADMLDQLAAETAEVLDRAEAEDAGGEFKPETEPAVETKVVTPDSISKTSERLEKQFDATTQRIANVTCPHCGESFGVDAETL